jgi:hypothetical protein
VWHKTHCSFYLCKVACHSHYFHTKVQCLVYITKAVTEAPTFRAILGTRVTFFCWALLCDYLLCLNFTIWCVATTGCSELIGTLPNDASSFGVEWVWYYEAVSKSFQTGRLERELQTVQLSATRCNCIAILWVSLVSFATIILCVASQRVFVVVVVVYFVIDSVRKLLDTPSYDKSLWDNFSSLNFLK